MTLILITLCLFVVCSIKAIGNNDEYLSKDSTNIIKGIFICLVFISHFISYKFHFGNIWIDTIGLNIAKKWEQLIVTLFLFYSGYGVMESAKRKGQQYIDEMPKKRIFKTWLHFAIAVIIFMIVSKYFITNPFSIKKIILALIGIDTFGNSNWYIVCIISMYTITYLSLKTFKGKPGRLGAVIVGAVLYCVVLSIFKPKYWYNSCACYVLGFAFSLYKEKFEKFFQEKWILMLVYSLVAFVISYKFKKNIFAYETWCILFTILVILISMKVKLKNPILKWLGANLFPIYIYQRIPMILFKRYNVFSNNAYLCFAGSIAISIAITYMYIGFNKLFFYIKEKTKLLKATKQQDLKG